MKRDNLVKVTYPDGRVEYVNPQVFRSRGKGKGWRKPKRRPVDQASKAVAQRGHKAIDGQMDEAVSRDE